MLVSLQGPKGLQAYKVSEWFKVNKVSNPMIENLLAYKQAFAQYAFLLTYQPTGCYDVTELLTYLAGNRSRCLLSNICLDTFRTSTNLKSLIVNRYKWKGRLTDSGPTCFLPMIPVRTFAFSNNRGKLLTSSNVLKWWTSWWSPYIPFWCCGRPWK